MTYLETWTVDGLVLNDGATYEWEYRSGTNRAGGIVGQNTAVPYRRGEIWNRKNYGPGSFVFNMWLAGLDAGDVFARYSALLRQVMRPERLVTWQRTPNDGSPARFCQGETVQALEPQYLGQTIYRLGIEVQVPAGKWLSSSSYAADAGPSPALPKRVQLPYPLNDSTTPMDDLIYTVTGPLDAGWTLADINGPDSLTVGQALGAGQQVVIDAGSWAITGVGGFTPNLAAFAPMGPRLMTATHGNNTTQPAVELRGSGSGPTTDLQVGGRASWLV